MIYNLTAFPNYFSLGLCSGSHWRICYDVANYTRKRRNVINFKKKFSEILSFQNLILVTGGYWDNKYHYLVPFPPRGKTRSIKDLKI